MNYTIEHVDVVKVNGVECFMVSAWIEGSDLRHIHTFPTDTLETRAAEYGMDVTDVDALLAMVLYEPLLGADAANADDSLYNADTITEARSGHLGRIKALRGTGVIKGLTGQADYTPAGPGMDVVDHSGTADPVAFLKARTYLDHDHVAVKRVHVQKLRRLDAEARAQRKARRGKRAERATAEQLHVALTSTQPDPNQPPITTPVS